MPSIEFGLSSYERGRGDLPELPVINLFAEEAPTEDKGIVLQSRPGLTDRGADMGGGPIDCLFQRDLVLGSALFGVSGGNLYEGETPLGAINGSGPFSMAGYEDFLFTAGGTSLWGYDGATLAAVTFPDSADVLKVIIGASRAICIRADTGKFYWSDPLEDDIEALDFATAENQPDRLLDCLFVDDTLVLFGAETVEFWPNTGDADLPFQPLEGRVIEKGVKATGCATAIGSSFAWVTNENAVCVDSENQVISNPGLQARIEAASDVRLWTFILEGVEFLALRLDGETQVFGWRGKTWSEFASYGESNWIPQCFAGGTFGSGIDGRTLQWGTGHADPDTIHERRFRAGFRPDSPLNITNLRLFGNVGQATDLAGDYVEPIVEMRLSLNHGKTWGNWRPKSLGAQGAYGKLVQWLALGMTKLGFGWLAEFRITAPVDVRVSDVKINDGWGGR